MTQQQLAEKHLSAYLQEVCYQAAQKIQRQFQSIQRKYSLADSFQIGNLLVNQPAKLFRSFKTDYQYSRLESYAKTAIFRFIGNTIYTQDIEAKREKFSNYGLLRDLNNKELKEALVSQGIQTRHPEIATVLKHQYPELQKQYQIARQLGKHHRNLLKLKELLQQCHQFNPDLSLRDDKATELIQKSLEDCLQSHCKRLMYDSLKQFAQQSHAETLDFVQAFETHLESDLDLSPKPLRSFNSKILAVIDEWTRSTNHGLQR